MPSQSPSPFLPPPLPSVYTGSRPVGKRRSPGLVILFGIITFGIYTLVWQWKISREMDAFTGIPNRHKILRTGILLSLLAGLVLAAGAGYLVAAAPDLATDPPTTEEIAGMLGVVGLILIAAALALTGTILMTMGFWRIWTALEHDDKMRAEPSPTSSGLLLTLFILGLVVPYVGIILVFVTYAMTQKGLNRTWNVYGSGMPPMPAATGAPA